jgi:hypothetical protein
MLGKIEVDEQDLMEWNRTVRGFMRVWDIAEVLGITPCLTKHLEELPHGDMAVRLSERGNCREMYLRLFVLSLRALLAAEPAAGESRSDPVWEEYLLSVLDIAVVRDSSPLLQLMQEFDGSNGSALSCLEHGGPLHRCAGRTGLRAGQE